MNKLFNLDYKHKNFTKRILAYLKKIDMETQEMLLEYCIISKEMDSKIKEEHRNYLLDEIFIGKYKKINDTYISWLLFDEKIRNYERIRCLKNIDDGWQDCDEDDIELFKNKDVSGNIEEIKNNPYGYYGLLEKDKKTEIINFKLVKILSVKTTKKNIIPSGKVCSTYEMFELIEILEKFKIRPENEDKKIWEKLQKLNKNDLISMKLNKKLKGKIEDMDDEDLIRKYIFWYNFDRKPICDKIQKVMKEKGLIIS